MRSTRQERISLKRFPRSSSICLMLCIRPKNTGRECNASLSGAESFITSSLIRESGTQSASSMNRQSFVLLVPSSLTPFLLPSLAENFFLKLCPALSSSKDRTSSLSSAPLYRPQRTAVPFLQLTEKQIKLFLKLCWHPVFLQIKLEEHPAPQTVMLSCLIPVCQRPAKTLIVFPTYESNNLMIISGHEKKPS